MDQPNKKSGIIKFSTLLVIIFSILKLTNNINWSWWWVFSPYWIPCLIIFSILFIIAFSAIIYLANTGKSLNEFIEKLCDLKPSLREKNIITACPKGSMVEPKIKMIIDGRESSIGIVDDVTAIIITGGSSNLKESR